MNAAYLLEHREFVARIARRLIDCHDEVEDVVQDTFVAALNSPEYKPRAWLARVARNLSIDRLRRRSARHRRELAAARAEGTASTAELAEQVAWQQRVVEAVLALDEPYRNVVLLRFYEELKPREIAARLGTPVETVRTRLRRALAQLRGTLEREAGGAQALGLALVPLGALPARGPVLGMKAAAAVLALVVATVGFAGHAALGDRRAEAPRGGRGGAAGLLVADGKDGPPAAAGDATVRARLVGELPAECAAAGGALLTIRNSERVLHTLRVSAGALDITYPREGRRVELELSGPRIVKRRFPLDKVAADLGTIHLQQSISFGGRVFAWDSTPLRGATVYWNGAAVASGPTDETGRYTVELPALPALFLEQKGYFGGIRLYVRKGRDWGGPYLAHPRGFLGKYDMRLQLEPAPSLRFLGGAGAKVTLHPYEPYLMSATLAEPLDRGTCGPDGSFAPAWRPWTGALLANLTLENGERLQVLIDREEAAADDVFEVDLKELAFVRLKVLDGDTPAAGARFRLAGFWSPDGVIERENGGVETPAGSRPVILYGEVPASGELAWRFPAEQKADACFVAQRWDCEYGGRVTSDHFGTPEGWLRADQVARNGGVLPPFRLAARRTEVREAIRLRLPHGATTAVCTGVTFVADHRHTFGHARGQRPMRFRDGRPGLWLDLFANQAVDRVFDTAHLHLQIDNELASVKLAFDRWRELARTEAPLDVTAITSAVRGKVLVLDPDGQPAPNVLVSAESDVGTVRTTTDAAGHARLGLASDDPHRIVAIDFATGAAAAIDGWAPGRRVKRVELLRPSRIRFRLLLPDKRPVNVGHGGHIGLMPDGAGNWIRLSPLGDGWFETPPVVPALYTLYHTRRHGKAMVTVRRNLGTVTAGETIVLR
jgi:RNA polymerase sigma-70 factor (ECF subfamily)